MFRESTANIHALEIMPGEIITPEDMITDISDATKVVCCFETEPDYSIPDDQIVTIILTDAGNNQLKLSETLTITPLGKEFEFEAAEGDLEPEMVAKEAFEDVDRLAIDGEICLNEIGTHDVKVKYNRVTYITKVTIKDTVAPTGKVADRTIAKGTKLGISDILLSYEDATVVSINFKENYSFSDEGSYPVTIVLTDEAGNATELNSTVKVVIDDVAPTISGVKDLNYVIGDSISYRSGVSVSDNCYGNVTLNVDDSNVDLNKAGQYTVYYTATDASLNVASASCVVTLKEPPSMEELANEKADIVLGQIISPGMSQLQMAKAIFDYARGMSYTGYSDKSNWVSEAYNGMKNRSGDCFTYYAVCRLLLTRCGISNIPITRVGGTSSHYWLLVNVGSGWYHYDACPQKNYVNSFMMGDISAESYTNKVGRNYYTYDASLYPEVEDNDMAY